MANIPAPTYLDLIIPLSSLPTSLPRADSAPPRADSIFLPGNAPRAASSLRPTPQILIAPPKLGTNAGLLKVGDIVYAESSAAAVASGINPDDCTLICTCVVVRSAYDPSHYMHVLPHQIQRSHIVVVNSKLATWCMRFVIAPVRTASGFKKYGIWPRL